MDEAPGSVVIPPEISQESLEVASSGGGKEKTSSENSEYDSVDSYSDEEQPVEIKARSKASGLDSNSESEGSVILEREEGDGQESVPQKKVDDDEDKKNPQYIPKRGTFYEHDDRTAEDIENQEADPEKIETEGKKKVWQDKKEKWSHDRFNDQEQAPKSRAELIAIYGYDIRNEDGPPRARRRRRYGRGPNKYTRNWEDEEAYTKPPAPRPQRGVKKPPRKLKNSEEFPALVGETNNRARTKSRSSDSNQEENPEIIEDTPQRTSVERQEPSQFRVKQPDSQTEQTQQFNSRTTVPVRVGTGRVVKPKKEIKDSDVIGFTTKTRQQRVVRNEPNQKVLPPRTQPPNNQNDFIQSQNFTNKTSNQTKQLAEMEKAIDQLNIQDGVYRGVRGGGSGNGGQNRQGSVPPRLQSGGEPKGSKRYSSMRQRSLPETSTPPAPVNFSFYPSDYNSTAPPPATQQPILAAPISAPTAMVAPQVPVSAAPPPLLQAPFPPAAAFAAQPPPAYLQAAPPTFIAVPPTQPQIVSYVAQPQPPYVQEYQNQFNGVTQPAELYQPQGITYYSTDQQIVQRAAPQKRPKVAIPIVAPNDLNRESLKEKVEESGPIESAQLQQEATE